MQNRIILIAQTVAHREIRADLPLILRISDQVILIHFANAGGATVERAGSAHVSQKTGLGGIVCQQIIQVGERVGRPTQAVRVHPKGAELAAEFKVAVPLDPTQAVDEREAVIGIGLATAILCAVGAHQAT